MCLIERSGERGITYVWDYLCGAGTVVLHDIVIDFCVGDFGHGGARDGAGEEGEDAPYLWECCQRENEMMRACSGEVGWASGSNGGRVPLFPSLLFDRTKGDVLRDD